MSAWTLRGTGRRDADTWNQLHAVTESWTAAWADVEGFHLETMPATPPVTTHVWAWSTGRWLRVRIDGAHWWAALLANNNEQEDDLWTTSESIAEPSITPLRHWMPDEGQVKQYRGSDNVLGEHSMIQITPLRRTTAAFLGHASTHQA
ncbi:hypothetical protein FHX42_002635 [Saccharopolyspora lacisalsi]|uniref:Uncharacterized protein n=1 Tax=Halosaccharopolyspora lacisalsi TaxID=1000566 RepID=A0A839DUY4_9PSEU|nr:hypothetical protein [Halosaccharopolyspora lacisalsi]MBA8825284.1 hypothetical protein [Halosaccharopolyspora lacisalsi]